MKASDVQIEEGSLSPASFAFWLMGFAEIHGGPPTLEQWNVIKEHLELVFTKVTVKTSVSKHDAPITRLPFTPLSSVGSQSIMLC